MDDRLNVIPTMKTGQQVIHRRIESRWFTVTEYFDKVKIIGIGAEIHDRPNHYNGFIDAKYNQVLVEKDGRQFTVKSTELFE